MRISHEEIEKLAKMSRIALAAGEAEVLAERLDAVLGYVAQVEEIAGDTEHITAAQPLRNVFRADIHSREPGAHTAKMLANAPKTHGRYVEVQKVLTQ